MISSFMCSCLAVARLVVIDPGHFHAALTQKRTNPLVADEVKVFAPEGRELRDGRGDPRRSGDGPDA